MQNKAYQNNSYKLFLPNKTNMQLTPGSVVPLAMLSLKGFEDGKTNLKASWTLRMMVIIQGRLLFAEWSMGEYGNIR